MIYHYRIDICKSIKLSNLDNFSTYFALSIFAAVGKVGGVTTTNKLHLKIAGDMKEENAENCHDDNFDLVAGSHPCLTQAVIFHKITPP